VQPDIEMKTSNSVFQKVYGSPFASTQTPAVVAALVGYSNVAPKIPRRVVRR
jgi:hypothetical protein